MPLSYPTICKVLLEKQLPFTTREIASDSYLSVVKAKHDWGRGIHWNATNWSFDLRVGGSRPSLQFCSKSKFHLIIQAFATLKSKHFLVLLMRDKSERIESSHSEEKSSLSCWDTEKEDTLILLFSTWDRSRDSTDKRNVSIDM